jgi:hypothetical protein
MKDALAAFSLSRRQTDGPKHIHALLHKARFWYSVRGRLPRILSVAIYCDGAYRTHTSSSAPLARILFCQPLPPAACIA